MLISVLSRIPWIGSSLVSLMSDSTSLISSSLITYEYGGDNCNKFLFYDKSYPKRGKVSITPSASAIMFLMCYIYWSILLKLSEGLHDSDKLRDRRY